MKHSPRVVVAMSGGVDSSVAAALLVQQNYQVVGIMLHLWSEAEVTEGNRCCTPEAVSFARRIAHQLNIPFYVIDAQQIFFDKVVKTFINGYAQGITPNPCLFCNRWVRWDFLLRKALSLEASYLVTGHYARIQRDDSGTLQLLRGLDTLKDQSYVLHILNQQQLSHTLFPLGELTKYQVRQLARDFDLPIAERPDSQDLCFVGSNDYRNFLKQFLPAVENPGPIFTQEGEEIGRHNGLAFYTIGQRKGLGISSPYPLYVIAKEFRRNALIVGPKDYRSKKELTAEQVNWISGIVPTKAFEASVKIRYKAQEIPAFVTPINTTKVQIRFETPVSDITPGQAAVIYNGEVCLGGGIIELPA